VLVPFPHAIDDHQRRNAEELERAGAAVVVRDEHATPETLAPRIAALLDDPDTLRQMAVRAAATGAVDASLRVVSDLEELTRVQR
jgi:UDP-N-acetylglucosamine--N-acetylmuramyl-(pentapeptide) pyrophosphoryl-undecaprenol N-acetylglucosamine transferase